MLLRDHGTWELADVLEFAIGYAQNGVPLVPRVPATIEGVRPLFQEEWHSSAEIWLPGGEVPAVDKLFANPTLAATWRRVLREAVGTSREARIEAARRAWYQGFVAEAIDGFFQKTEALDVSGRRHRGLLAGQDLAEWEPTIEAPISYDYAGHTVLKCGPWSQGPVFLQQLALLAGFDVAAMDPVGADFAHTVIECMKLAYADREAFYGDPNFTDVPLETLLSPEYNDERRRMVGAEASMDLRPGTVANRSPWVDRDAASRVEMLSRAPGAGEPTVARMGVIGADTVHIDVIDRWGNMVSATPSGGWLQSSPAVPGLGFCLGTRGQMFWLKPDLPNSLLPKKRPRTTLSPSMALRDGKPWMAFGTPGGEQQDQWSPIFFLRRVHYGLGIQAAIDMPSFHTEHWPSSFWPRAARPGKVVLEGRYSPAVRDELERRGHLVTMGEDWSEGRLSGTDIVDGLMHAGANPRGAQGYAVGR
jgi:gamma-glutamyltranspeptidase/glutathione hydrolase